MQLIDIDKTRYRKHLNFTFAAIAIALIIISLTSSTLYIALLSTPEASHFFHNLAGVITAAAIVIYALNKLRHHPYLVEVVYVWDLKQQLNRIHRKQRQLDKAITKGNHNAMIIVNFQYHGSKQLYELDDNTITMDDLMRKMNSLSNRMQEAGLSPSTSEYKAEMLDQF